MLDLHGTVAPTEKGILSAARNLRIRLGFRECSNDTKLGHCANLLPDDLMLMRSIDLVLETP
ncbi:MAG: hypothetical protein ISR54_09825 [Chlorobium phaeobacteroides]|uniref:Uncharacterized protein n=1 Tax=Chlorobium phaeobacteroides (strain BS1) TaxID=331678 RepID=B3EKQ0_CHLPB|nr:hypothetical protein [Chlorobium phaeobacteroides]MBL6957091.1 hypothetical protein [Chlorobium phaeobacteroides]